MNREECHHKVIYFSSGDYYIFCRDCPAQWVTCKSSSDQPSPGLANQGVGMYLSGEVRRADDSPAEPTK